MVAAWAAGRRWARRGVVALGGGLVGGDDEKFAEAAGGAGIAGLAAAGAEIADGDEGFVEKGVGETGAERGEEGRPRGLFRVVGGEAVGADVAALLVAPAGLAVESAESDGEDGAFGQGAWRRE